MASDPQWERLGADEPWNAWYLEGMGHSTGNAWDL